MEEMAQEENYQGVIAIVPPFEYVEVEDILKGVEGAKKGNFTVAAMYDKHSENHAEEIKTLADYYIYDFKEMIK